MDGESFEPTQFGRIDNIWIDVTHSGNEAGLKWKSYGAFEL